MLDIAAHPEIMVAGFALLGVLSQKLGLMSAFFPAKKEVEPTPKEDWQAPDRESFHLGMAREAYANGNLSMLELEQSIDHVLKGGHLGPGGKPARVKLVSGMSARDATDALNHVMRGGFGADGPVVRESQFTEPKMEKILR